MNPTEQQRLHRCGRIFESCDKCRLGLCTDEKIECEDRKEQTYKVKLPDKKGQNNE